MTFSLKNKVAIISGGASGIGLTYAKELLKNGLRGVTLADINAEYGKKALEDIEGLFGPNKAIFVSTDVTNKDSFEDAFKKTVETYKNLDILINNAGIFNDRIWEQELAININGTVHGVLLALEHYIPKYKTGSEGVIVNISSIAGLAPSTMFPLYTASKYAIVGMTKAFGAEVHFKRTNVKVLTLCPGVTETPMITEMSGRTLGPPYQSILEGYQSNLFMQKPESVAAGLVEIIKNAKSGTVWVVEDDKQPYEYVHPPRGDFAPKLQTPN